MISATLLLSMLLPVQEGLPGKFTWTEDLEKAMAQSKKDGRPVITYWTFET